MAAEDVSRPADFGLSPPATTLIVTQAEVARLLPMDDCMEVMARALEALSRGQAVLPERQIVRMPESQNLLLVMPSYLGAPPAIGLKAVTLFPENTSAGAPVIQGAVLLFDARHGRLLAVMDANEITAIRTAAVSGVATRLLAREDAGDLAILGSGVQARSHLAAMLAARQIRRLRVWSRNAEHARRFAERAMRRHGLALEVAETAEEAVRGADIICSTTATREPVLHGAWVAPGAHINAVGAGGYPSAREMDTALIVRGRLFADRREGVLAESGDMLIPLQEGAITREHIRADLGEVLLGRAQGRTAPEDITIFKSTGIAVEDAAAAEHIYRKAVERGIGTAIDLSGGSDEQGAG